MTDDMKNPDDWAQAAEYTLGLLSTDDARAFEAAMAADPALRATYAQWADDFAAFTDNIAPVTPPAQIKARVDAVLFKSDVMEKQSWLSRFGLAPAIGGGLVGAVAVLWLLDASGMMRWLDKPEFTARVAAQDDSLIVQASYDVDTGVLLLNRTEGAAAEGRVLELWLVAGTAAPVSLGLLGEAQTLEITVPSDIAAGIAGGVLAISDEPPGGSPTGAPTGDVLAVGPIVTL